MGSSSPGRFKTISSASVFRLFALLAGSSALVLVCSLAAPHTAWAEEGESWSKIYARAQQEQTVGDLQNAETDYRTVLNLLQKQPNNAEDRENCLRKLADTLALLYKTEEARALYKQLLDLTIKRYGRETVRIGPVLVALGSIEESVGNHTGAMSYYKNALHIYEKKLGPYSPAFAKTLMSYNAAAQAGKRGMQAKPIEQGAELEASKHLARNIHESGDILKSSDISDRELVSDFASDILQSGKVSNAQVEHESGEPISESDSAWQKQGKFQLRTARTAETDENAAVLSRMLPSPASDASLAPAYKIMNDTIFNQNHYERTEAASMRQIATDIDALGPYHPSVANDLNGLAQLYTSQERYGEAERLLKRALAIYRKVYGSNNVLTINTTVALASVEYHLGHNEEAANLYRDALSQGQKALGPNAAETARVLNELANLYFHQGKLSESCTLYQWAAASTEGALGKDSPMLAACLKDYGRVLRASGRAAEAEAIDARAQEILVNAQVPAAY